jgi:hypothetical protein
MSCVEPDVVHSSVETLANAHAPHVMMILITMGAQQAYLTSWLCLFLSGLVRITRCVVVGVVGVVGVVAVLFAGRSAFSGFLSVPGFVMKVAGLAGLTKRD